MDARGSGKPKCTGKRAKGGMPCSKWPMKGQTVCRNHGGASPQAKAAAERRITEAQLSEAVQTYGLPIDVSPTEALLDEVKWTAGHVTWLRMKVQEFTEEALTWGKRSVVDKVGGEFPGTDTTEAAGPPILLDLYQRERAHLVSVCKAALQAGVEERRVRLAESQGAMLADVIRRILGDLDLTAEQTAKVSEVVPRHLRAVS